MQPIWSTILADLLWSGPELVVVTCGIILAARWLQRAPSAARLALIGLGLMLAQRLIMIGLNVYARTQFSPGYQMMAILTYGLYIIRCLGLSVLLSALFAGRTRIADGRAFEVQPPAADRRAASA